MGKVRLCSDLKHVVKSGRVWGDDQGLVEKYEIGCTPSFLLSKNLQALKTDLKNGKEVCGNVFVRKEATLEKTRCSDS